MGEGPIFERNFVKQFEKQIGLEHLVLECGRFAPMHSAVGGGGFPQAPHYCCGRSGPQRTCFSWDFWNALVQSHRLGRGGSRPDRPEHVRAYVLACVFVSACAAAKRAPRLWSLPTRTLCVCLRMFAEGRLYRGRP